MTSQTNPQALNASSISLGSGLVPVAALLLLGFALGFAMSEIRQGPAYMANAVATDQKTMITNDWHGNVQRSNHY